MCCFRVRFYTLLLQNKNTKAAIPSNRFSFSVTTYLPLLEGQFFYKVTAFQRAKIVPLSWSICFFIHMKRNFFKILKDNCLRVSHRKMTMLSLLIILNLKNSLCLSIHQNQKSNRLLTQLILRHCQTFASNLTTSVISVQKCMTNETILILRL